MSETFGIIPSVQFVMVRFSLLDSPGFDEMDARAVKLYLKLRRYVWRSEKGPLADWFRSGYLVADGYMKQWGDWLGVSKSTASRMIACLVEAGWIAWGEKSAVGKAPNVIILGVWQSLPSGERLEIFYVDHGTVSEGKRPVSLEKRPVSLEKPSNIEQIENRIENEQGTEVPLTGEEELEAAGFGPKPEALPVTVEDADKPWIARHSLEKEPWRAWGVGQSVEGQDRGSVPWESLQKVGQALLQFAGVKPDWADSKAVSYWLKESAALWRIAEGRVAPIVDTIKGMRADGLSIKGPQSVKGMLQDHMGKVRLAEAEPVDPWTEQVMEHFGRQSDV
jgi:hypothetical protein